MAINNSRIGTQIKTHQPDLINIYDSSVGDECIIGTFVEIGGADIGERCDLGSYVNISPKCRVGNDVVIGHNTVLMTGAKIGNGARIGSCCVIATNVEVGDEVIIKDGVCVSSDVRKNDTIDPAHPDPGIVWRSGKPYQSKVFQAVPGETHEFNLNDFITPPSKVSFPDYPAVSSDHPAYTIAEETNPAMEANRPRQEGSQDPVQLTMDDLFQIAPPGLIQTFLNKKHACKGRCMSEPKTGSEDDLLGLGIRDY